MARKKRIKPEIKDETPVEQFRPFVDEPATVETTSNLDTALEGFDREPELSLSDNPIGFQTGIADEEQPKQKRKYTKRQKSEDVDNDLQLLEGEEIQMIIDLIIPMGIAGIHNMVSKEKVSPDDLMLTPKQESKMNKVCQKVADRIKMSVNPFVALFVMVAAAYGGNYMKAKP